MQPTVLFRPSMRHRILTEQHPTLEYRVDGSLCVVRGESSIPVTVRPCFPWSEAPLGITAR